MATIIPRAAWGARHGRGFGPAPVPAQEVWLHHSVTVAPDLVPPYDDDDRAIRTIEDIGEERFGGGIPYTFLVTPAGRVYEGHGVDRRGAHTKGRNTVGRAVCLVGDYETQRPSEAQVDAVAALLVHGKAEGWWRDARLAGGHRDAPGAATACPGHHAYAQIEEINRRAASGGGGMTAADVWEHVIGNDQLRRPAFTYIWDTHVNVELLVQMVRQIEERVAALEHARG